jgi:hypothetical protein
MTRTLSPVQQNALLDIASGATISAAAARAEIHRSTVHLWMKDSALIEALNQARHEFTAGIREQCQELEILALITLRQLLENTDTPPAVRLKAALAILGQGKSAQLQHSCLDLLQSLQPESFAGQEFDCPPVEGAARTRRPPVPRPSLTTLSNMRKYRL